MSTKPLTPILGLPALLSMRPDVLRDFIVTTHSGTDTALLCMQMYYVLMALSQDDFALDMQSRALRLQRVYRIAGPTAPTIRLLAFMAPGNMLANTPLDLVVANNAIQLDLIYLSGDGDWPPAVPEHDIAFVAIGESGENDVLLKKLETIYAVWPQPVLNRPAQIQNCARDACWRVLRGIPNLVIPETRRITRQAIPADLRFPCTIRPVDTHGGTGLTRIDSALGLDAYFAKFPQDTHYLADYVDYQSNDGYFRKIRIVMIDGAPYVCHMAISDHWIVHYQSAGMELFAWKRAEEQRFMENFQADFALRFAAQMQAMAQRLGLDYVTVDCAEMQDGRLLVFEVDTRGLVHAMDPVDIYPYKPAVLQIAFDAFEAMLVARA